jgi:hypothetical protein
MPQATETAVRRSARIFVRMPVEIVVDSETTHMAYPASTVDLSAHGARVQTKIALVPGERINFVWRGATPQRVPSQVVWSAQGQPEQWREAGLQFLEPIQVGV